MRLLPNTIEIPSGEALTAVNLPGASLCADFLVEETTCLWAGITVPVHRTDLSLIASVFELASDSMVRLILPNDARLLPRYRDEGADWGWLEVKWADDQRVRIRRALSNQALWYCLEPPRERRKHVVVMALENIDYMLTELDGDFHIPSL